MADAGGLFQVFLLNIPVCVSCVLWNIVSDGEYWMVGNMKEGNRFWFASSQPCGAAAAEVGVGDAKRFSDYSVSQYSLDLCSTFTRDSQVVSLTWVPAHSFFLD